MLRNHLLIHRLKLMLVCLLVASISVAQSLPKGVKKLTSVEGITEYELDNGLKFLLFPDPSKPTITVNVTYLVGSRHEGYGESGMAHLLEHLVFKGTPNHPNIPQELSEHGARPNGTTSYDRTNYYETFAATEDNLKWALDLESDRMVNSYIAKKDLDSEFSVVRNEFESGESNPFRVLMQRVIDLAYSWHNYGKSTIGNRSDIERVPIENLQAFYRKYYQPDNAVLMVAGQIDEAKTIALVAEYFGKIPRPERVLPKTYTVEPTQDGERTVEVRRVGDIQYLIAAYHIPSGVDPDFAPTEILVDLLTAEPSGRLYKNLVGTQKASAQFAYPFQLHDPGFALFGAEVTKDKSLEEARKVLIATLDSLQDWKPSAEELERSKTKLLKEWDMQFRSSGTVGLAISEYIAMGDWRLAFIGRDRIKAVKPEDIARVAAKYFKPSNRTLGMFIPEDKPNRVEVPERVDISELVKNYKGEKAIAQGEAFDASPANIDSRTTVVGKAGGLRQVFLPKKTRGNAVVAHIIIRHGDEKSLQNKGAVPSLMSSMLDKGTTSRTRQQIKDALDKLDARVGVGGGASTTSVGVETTRDNLPAVIKIVADILKSPSFPEDEFEKLRQEKLAGLESEKGDPNSVASEALRRALSIAPKGDPRYTPTIDESIEELKSAKLSDIKQFYKEFMGTNNATVTVIGDFDKAEIEKLVAKELGNWKSLKPYKRLDNLYSDTKPATQVIATPDKANAVYRAGMLLPIKDTDTDYPALVIGNYILGGGFLNSRLATRIRQKDGLSYGVGSGLNASSLDKYANFSLYAIYAPQNATKLEAAMKEEINRVLTDGFTEDELKAAKSGYLQSRQVSRTQDTNLSYTLGNNVFIGRTMAYDADFESKIQNLTVQQINEAFRKYISTDKLVIIKAGDFSKAEVK